MGLLFQKKYLLLGFLYVFFSCKNNSKGVQNEGPVIRNQQKLFTQLLSEKTGISFKNTLVENLKSNYYKYMYSYIGGGIAAADFNNDGLEDLFFISNSDHNKLYLNKGDLKFEDITNQSKIKHENGFDTGVTTVDVNNDGFTDIYITRGGFDDNDNKFKNKLYINNGDLTFTQKAEEYGLADDNRGIQATFFDFDNDNDLDVYISNTPDIEGKTKITDLSKIAVDPNTLKLKGSDKLYENNGKGYFLDISEKAGILPDIGFGLNPQVGDINNDGFLDIYISNDFKIPDFVYINNGDGTFTDQRNERLKHMSFNSMGGDIVDINNDGFYDILTLDMNPEDYVRSKTTMAMTSIGKFELMVKKNYHHQYMHNMLQINKGDGTFSEIANMAGIANTDWSWSVLSADFDLDGNNDIYITNGVYRDVINRDKNNEIVQILRKNKRKPTSEDFLKFTKMLPQQKMNNYFFRNKGDLTFEDVTDKWNDTIPTFSNGAVYVDLDNDGDLEVVVNNINQEATILKNNAVEKAEGNFLRIAIKGPKSNRSGVGVRVKMFTSDDEFQVRQLINSRGFLSSVNNKLHFGVSKEQTIKKVEVVWPDGRTQVLKNIVSNSLLKLSYENAKKNQLVKKINKPKLFEKEDFNVFHKDPYFKDYETQLLLPYKLSQTGPSVAKEDVNNDGIIDFYIGGGHSQPGQLFIGKKGGGFIKDKQFVFEKDKQKEDISACFFDSDGDGDKDLYVVSGSYEFNASSKLLQDRLYINDGKGKFKKSKNYLPMILKPGSVVVPEDFDNDGDVDLFVGTRLVTGKYPYPATSFLLENEKGYFKIVNETRFPELQEIGMVTDAIWNDINKDGSTDLIITGEWMGIEVFLNKGNKFEKSQQYKTLLEAKGWWNKLLLEDVDNDGDVDIVAGNLGLNTKFHTSLEKPFQIYTKDFDFNGTEDIVLTKFYKGKKVPIRGKVCTAQQIPHLANKISTYSEFANNDIEGILGKGINSALHYKVTEFRSGVFFNRGKEGFEFEPFGNHVQSSPVNSILYEDFDSDGIKDLLLAGNNYNFEVETTRSDAGFGSFLKGSLNGKFKILENHKCGFYADGDVRDLIYLKSPYDTKVLVINNNNHHLMYNVN